MNTEATTGFSTHLCWRAPDCLRFLLNSQDATIVVTVIDARRFGKQTPNAQIGDSACAGRSGSEGKPKRQEIFVVFPSIGLIQLLGRLIIDCGGQGQRPRAEFARD